MELVSLSAGTPNFSVVEVMAAGSVAGQRPCHDDLTTYHAM